MSTDDTLRGFFARPRTLHAAIAASDPKLERGRVWCTRCRSSRAVDSAKCLAEGWPRCCGATMTIDSPAERKAAAR